MMRLLTLSPAVPVESTSIRLPNPPSCDILKEKICTQTWLEGHKSEYERKWNDLQVPLDVLGMSWM